METKPDLYVSKPSLVEAVRWTGSNRHEVTVFGGSRVRLVWGRVNLYLLAGVDTNQEWVPVPVGSWIARMQGDSSHYWSVENRIFENQYDSSPVLV